MKIQISSNVSFEDDKNFGKLSYTIEMNSNFSKTDKVSKTEQSKFKTKR